MVKEICEEVIVMDIEKEKFVGNRKYDAVVLSHVCEHLRYPGIIIKELSNSLNVDGIIIIALPNMAFLKNRLKLLRGDWAMNTTGPFDNTHLHFYSFNSANSVYNNDLELVKKIPGNLAIPLWPLRKLFPRFCNKLDVSVGRHFPNLFAQQTILVLKKLK
jgi:SAM-dependent methyltransferase